MLKFEACRRTHVRHSPKSDRMALLKPGQRVIYFPPWAASGGFIECHHGTVIGIYRDIFLRESEEDDRSIYRVRFANHGCRLVHGYDLVPLQQFGPTCEKLDAHANNLTARLRFSCENQFEMTGE